jgi:hypothetical protein
MTRKTNQIIELAGSLSSADMRKTSPVFFEVPEDVTSIHFLFKYEPMFAEDQRLSHQIRLMIFDTNGPRCAVTKLQADGVTISEAQATPGGTPGPIPAGRWRFFILVDRLLSDSPVTYKMTISMSFDSIPTQPKVWEPGTVAARGAGWYRGDLHAHTTHSDGHWNVSDLVQFWRDREVDFMTLSDHNTISGLPELHSLSDDRLLTLGGCEFTTYFGHAVAVGINQWFDWRKLDGSVLTMPELAQEVIDSGGLLTIAHPMDEGDPMCCGCRWQYYDMMPENALAVEIWNEHWHSSNQESLLLFYRWLNEGHRLTAVSGTDMHRPQPDVRNAVNVVYAQEFSERGILDAIKAGHSYVSAGPELLLTANTASGQTAMIGDTLQPEDTIVSVKWDKGHENDSIRLILDGNVYREKIVGTLGEAEWQLQAGIAKWFNVELRDADNGLWAVTNPIFFENLDQ